VHDPRLRMLQSGDAHHRPPIISMPTPWCSLQVLLSDLFKTFPKLKFIIPHGGGAVPFHWGRFRGIALNNGKPELAEIMGDNIFFDTCVYHQAGHRSPHQVVPIDNILFASEMVGAVKGNDPRPASASTTPSATSTKRPSDATHKISRAMRARSTAGSTRPPRQRRTA